jgi:hypothetical protein
MATKCFKSIYILPYEITYEPLSIHRNFGLKWTKAYTGMNEKAFLLISFSKSSQNRYGYNGNAFDQ